MSERLAKSSLIFSSMTFLSRILGFIRDAVAAQIFGASAGYDAFIIAQRIPNLLRRLFAEGAFSQAFVPVIAEYKQASEQGKALQLQQFISKVAGCLMLVLIIVTALGILLAPWIIKLFAPGFNDVQQLELARILLQITFPYILLVSMAGLVGGILNSYGKFALPSFTPAVLNISIILCSIGLSKKFANPEISMAIGVLLGGVLQLGIQLPSLRKLGLLPSLTVDWQDPGVKKVLTLMLPALLGCAAFQLNSMIDSIFASHLVTGSISWLYYSERLMEFPLGLFGVALSSVVLPHLAAQYVSKAEASFSKTIDWGIRCILFLGIPSVVGLWLLSGPIISTLFKSQKFSNYDVLMCQSSLQVYATAIVWIMFAKIFATSFISQQDTRTPVKATVLSLVVNTLFNFLLYKEFAHVGLAISTSIAAFSNCGFLYFVLVKRGIYVSQQSWLTFMLKILLSNLVMGCIINYLVPDIDIWLSWSRWYRAQILLEIIFVGSLSYIAMLWLMRFNFKDYLFERDFVDDSKAHAKAAKPLES